MSLLPARSNRDLVARQTARSVRAQQNAELAIHRGGLAAQVAAEIDRLEGQALADALRASLDEELSLLDHGLARAGGSLVKAELVAAKLDILSSTNNRRISRRFGS